MLNQTTDKEHCAPGTFLVNWFSQVEKPPPKSPFRMPVNVGQPTVVTHDPLLSAYQVFSGQVHVFLQPLKVATPS